MQKNIIVIGEHQDGRVKPVTYEAIALARQLQHEEQTRLRVVILGAGVQPCAAAIAATAGCDVLAVSLPKPGTYTAEAYVTVLAELLPEFHPTWVCIPHTSQGADYAPALAVKLQAGCISGVEDLSRLESHWCFDRPLYGGKITGRFRPLSATTVLTIQPGAFKFEAPARPAAGEVRVKSVAFEPAATKFAGFKQSQVQADSITEAEVIVAAGQGIGEKEKLALIYELASVFGKSAVAGSRIVCDRGWLDYSRQVGVTGATVAPRLYIACGISGALQHVTGMGGSEFIVAINKDPAAAIFQVSDVCVVEDLTTFIPEFIQACGQDDDANPKK